MESAKLVRSFALRAAAANAVMVAHVIPIRRTACDIFMRCAGVLVMTPVTVPHAPPIELVQSLFDLTPAEARVARSLTAGGTVEEIASLGGVLSTRSARKYAECWTRPAAAVRPKWSRCSAG